MAKAFLLRWGYEEDFTTIKLQEREPGFALDTEKFYIGSKSGNLHVPNEKYINTMIINGVALYKPMTGDTLYLSTNQPTGSVAFNTTTARLQYKVSDTTVITIATRSDIPLSEPVSIKVAAENIDTEDGNSVLITGYSRNIIMVYRAGLLCTQNEDDVNRIEVDSDNSTLKVYGCSENDIIAYY